MDRNIGGSKVIAFSTTSLSARRAWIEMYYQANAVDPILVALRKESVDRNLCLLKIAEKVLTSLSARRAWIEI